MTAGLPQPEEVPGFEEIPEPVPVQGPRSARTAAAAVVATAVLVIGGALLYDVIAVRTGHQARPWRAKLAHELATRHLDDPWVLTGAGIAVLLGVWLCVLAFTPGMRRWLPLRQEGAVIDRSGVAALITARAEELPGVDSVAVRVRQNRTRVTVTGAADPAGVQRALRAELARIPLAGPNQLDVRAHRPGRHH
ncbi:hypothetical protein GCM10010193_61090 [Kitasatospora atroaurantiaca]|uniref:DUF6286 domain-containing protein n=1 Tax=Kitasatospora atroaurantiaca TaxID=285545 RepID=A0A561EX40_9ACTN|nr:DUF6286 domain-containing protein [Kitasatospora atroaurantiaca]TWE20174.1 hypothetical protein FB465_5316 [Kitasatospora atroaurantiaca]